MRDVITITRKGQTTLPVAIRRKLGLDDQGGRLSITFNEARGELVISRAPTPQELGDRISRHLKPGTPPLHSVDDYYQTHRRSA